MFCRLPNVFSSPKTLAALHNMGSFGKNADVQEINGEVYIKDIKVKRFAVSHDSIDCGGFWMYN